MKRAVAYLRVSTPNQTGDDKFGIESQRDMIKDYCVEHDIEVVNWYIDEAVSGTAVRRPAFDKILAGEVTNPPVQYVIVAKADRISRDVTLYHSFKFNLKEIGLEILSVKEDWSAQDKLTAMILENFLAMVSEIERENIRIRMSGGRKVKAKQGGYSGGQPPMGYKVINGRLVVNEEEAEVVRYAFQMKKKGATMQATADALNKRGFKSRSGRPFVTSSIQSLWNNERTFRGEYKYGKDGTWVKGEHDAILTDN